MPSFERKDSGATDSETVILGLVQGLGISPYVAKLLANRSIIDVDEASKFLNPSYDNFYDPFLFRDMAKASERIKKAISCSEQITVYGDYDVDGITAAAILFFHLKEQNADVKVYLPSRHSEGYGLNTSAIASIAGNGTTLIITVDCGVSAVEEVEYAKSLGVDVIITDHHICSRQKPDAYALIATCDESEVYPFKFLCGAGLAAKLVQALGGMEAVDKVIDLAAIGTVADMVPLLGENRVFVAKGLEKISLNPRVGIEALINVSGFDKKVIDAAKISFGLAPRLNAAGRIALAKLGFDLLISENYEVALEMAHTLNEHNAIRQRLEEQIVSEIKEKVEGELNLSNDRIIIIEGENWHKGVIGIAASKIVEAYSRPCLLISVKDGKGSGSARSINGFNIFEALSTAKHLFHKLGGHAKAAGFSLSAHNIPLLKQCLGEYAKLNITDEMIVKKSFYDDSLKLTDITPELASDIAKLAPFGMSNPTPVFLFGDVIMEDVRYIGNDLRHVKFAFKAEQKVWDGIGFGLAHEMGNLTGSGAVEVLAGIETNEWMGVSRIQLMVKALKRDIISHKDIDTVLKPFYFKFADVFLSNIGDASFRMSDVGCQASGEEDREKEAVRYDGSCIELTDFEHQRKNDISRQTSDIRHRDQSDLHTESMRYTKLDLDEVLSQIRDSSVGHMFIINSIMGAKWLFGRLIEHSLMGGFSVRFCTTCDLSENTVVLAPDFGNIPFGHYNRIFVLEGEEFFCPDRLFKEKYAPHLYVVKTNQDASTNRKSHIENLKINREFLAHFYKWLKYKKNGRLIWKDMVDLVEDYAKSSDVYPNGFQVSVAAEIFSELGFISKNIEHRCLRIECLPNPHKRSLSASKTYNCYKKFMNRFDLTINGGNTNGFETDDTHYT